MTTPDATAITYAYGSGTEINNEASRLYRQTGGGVTFVTYKYLGVADVVGTSYAQPNVMWNMFGATSGDYEALDDFNRVVTSRWTADLSTDVDFYDVDIAYDRNSNITLIEDNVHTGFDVDYTIDDTDRLTQAEEGTWSGSAITSKSRDQQWTLDHLGNWDRDKLDLDGDGSFTGTDEHDDSRTHNKVNELTGRDTDSDSTDDFTLVYDAVGNLTDDGESYKYEYDAFGRMRKILDRGDDSLIAEYEYNGLGFRQASHQDGNGDGDVDGDDPWYYYVYDERWRMVSVYRAADSDPKEEFVNHQAGLSGRGGSSYIDLVVCRNRDDNTDWIAASDGTLERRDYYCQNWRADVSALIKAESATVEWVKYSAYGVPFGMPAGDTDSDGDCDATDISQVQTWINASAYDVRGDVDLDGDVDSTDKSTLEASYEGAALGNEALSDTANRKGFSGYEINSSQGTDWHVRNRVLNSVLGRWTRRDPLSYVNGLSLHEYVSSSPIGLRDPSGLKKTPCGESEEFFAVVDGFSAVGFGQSWSLAHQYIMIALQDAVDDVAADVECEPDCKIPPYLSFPCKKSTVKFGPGSFPGLADNVPSFCKIKFSRLFGYMASCTGFSFITEIKCECQIPKPEPIPPPAAVVPGPGPCGGPCSGPRGGPAGGGAPPSSSGPNPSTPGGGGYPAT